MRTMKRNARTLTAILALVTGAATLTRGAPADDRNWATRVKCELQTAGGESLQTLTWQQGTTPLLSLDQYRSGKELSVTNAANTNVTAILFIGASATNASYAVVTNYAVVNNGFLFKVPTVGTNTQGNAAGWWYAVYFEQAGSRYWTGNGRVDIVKTTSTADGLAWSAIVPPVVITAGDATNAARAVVGASGTVWRAEWVAGDTAEAALRASGDVKGTNYTDAVAAGKVSTSDPAYLAACTGSVYVAGLTTYVSNRVTYIGTNAFAAAAQTNVTHNSLLGIGGAGTLHVTAAETNKIATAWQNPASSTNWTWTSDGTNATMTSYSGPAAVVIPDKVDNLFVTSIGTIFAGKAITSISGGANVTTLGTDAFYGCSVLTSVSLPSVTTIGSDAFTFCGSLTSIGLYNATTIGTRAFFGCTALTSVYFSQNAPAEGSSVYLSAPNVTNYATNPQATGWGATWNGRPVVRLPVYADEYWRLGTNLTTLLDGKVATNDLRVVNALTNFNDTIHGVRGGLNLHALADANGAGFYSADHYKAVTSMKGRTNVWDSAVPSTPAGIAAAGGVTTNAIPGPGCTYLGTSQAVTLTGATTSYRSEPAGVYTVSVAQAASRYTYALEVISTNPCTLAAGLNLQGSWTITGTNILCVVPCTGTLWRVYGRGI